ncbi:Inosine/uridine-preferring nucleoside hydrolase domain-containing protein [Apiosordaria backusii]|uniref:Inosine/uridine-preferring nucleoside hydrolase domain-containing protein n=1 Tax=Apiosordaria backusii TaxID=314023 RepID=A0AA40DK83_9PEZI|nr:Inosine/uridine-preferring nucleoside hydrolase domain-containing protein [Apiosordaria backusii]
MVPPKIPLIITLLLSSASSHPSPPSPKHPNSTRPKVILDNDWNPTAFIAFLLPLHYNYTVLGLASDTANSWALQTGLHALASLEIASLSSCIPVYKGSDYPLLQTAHTFQTYELLHGELPWKGVFAKENKTNEQLGNDPTSGDPRRVVREAFTLKQHYGYPNGSFAEGSAAEFMVRAVRESPGRVKIFSGGSLTNIALAVRLDPDFAKNTDGLYIMGGDVLRADLVSDINFVVDPEAAKIVLTADFPNITLVANSANGVIPDQAFLDELVAVNDNPLSRLVRANQPTFLPFWDETAACVMVDREGVVLEEVEVYVDVDTSFHSPFYGYIRPYQAALMPPGLRTVRYINKVNDTKVAEMIKRVVQFPPRSCAELGVGGEV